MLDYSFIQVEYEKDNSAINKLYEQVIIVGSESFPSFEEYSKSISFLVQKYVSYNDYLHSNNLLQTFRTNCLSSRKTLPSWFDYFSIKIYSKRAIKHYLDNPSKFWEVIYRLAKSTEDDWIERLDNLIVDTLEFYKIEYTNYPEFLHDSVVKFVRYYKRSGKRYSEPVDLHIDELEKLTKVVKKDEVKLIFDHLKSKNIIEDEEADEVLAGKSGYEAFDLLEKVVASQEAEENYFGDIHLSDEDSKKKILVVGDDPFVHKKDIIYGIGKTYNVKKDQFEFFDDYKKITSEGERIVNKTQWNDKYIGIIFGSTPHKTSGNEDDSSLITKCSSTPGFPMVVVCRVNNNSGKPKITASSFKNALRQIILNFKS